MIMTGNELKELRNSFGYTQTELAEELFMTRRSIAKLESMKEIPDSRAQHLRLFFESIENNNDVLVNGPMSFVQNKNGVNYEELPNGNFLIQVPIIHTKERANYLAYHTNRDYIINLIRVTFIVNRIGNYNYRAFEVVDDSMNDGSVNSIPWGALVLARELSKDRWYDKLKYNEYPFWVIVHKDGILFKQIIDHDVKNGCITCHRV